MPRETSLNHLPLGRTHVFMRHHVLILFFGYMWLITKALLVYTHWLQFFFYFFDFFNYSWHNIRLVVVNHQNSYIRKSQRDYFWYLCFTVKKKFFTNHNNPNKWQELYLIAFELNDLHCSISSKITKSEVEYNHYWLINNWDLLWVQTIIETKEIPKMKIKS